MKKDLFHVTQILRETENQRSEHLSREREQKAILRAQKTPEQRLERLANQQDRSALNRASKTTGQISVLGDNG